MFIENGVDTLISQMSGINITYILDTTAHTYLSIPVIQRLTLKYIRILLQDLLYERIFVCACAPEL